MTYRELVEETETHRAWIVADESPQEPDWDGQAHIFEVGTNRSYAPQVSTRHVDYSRDDEAEGLRAALWEAFNRSPSDGLDWELAERYLRAFYDVVSFDYMAWGSNSLVAVVTRGLADAWGCPGPCPESTRQALEAWRQYAEGDVWGVVIEERAHERIERTSLYFGVTEEEERDVWVDTGESLWGCYGSQYAQEEARSMLPLAGDDGG